MFPWRIPFDTNWQIRAPIAQFAPFSSLVLSLTCRLVCLSLRCPSEGIFPTECVTRKGPLTTAPTLLPRDTPAQDSCGVNWGC